MRDTVSRGRSADANGVRGLLLVALLALLHAALLAGACHLTSSQADHCLTRPPAAAASGTATVSGVAATSGASAGHCVTEDPGLTSAGAAKKHHPASGGRHHSQASGCQLRPHQAPTGNCGKTFGDASPGTAVAPSGDASPGAVRTTAGAPPGRSVVLRC
ncbi:hypothetical protein [Streptomyces chattanoogensis]|uniref:Uncharacterized protein n=1 Tax=Streptomyces chattanoogensis TaxID=66876 RepID=A0A0N0H149_9ACTN|nr:hypothetical protein [Streptomyces chattanoogensis]KPC63930.1 hypothetical protein ADL29_14825 [Streptomyces chattanoogensis]